MAALTDAKRRANNKYIKENMTGLGCKIRKDEAEKFKAVCRMNGDTPNAIFRAAIDRYMMEHVGGQDGPGRPDTDQRVEENT